MQQIDTIVFYNGVYMPKSEVRISPDDRGFLFGDGVYEVIRAYYGKLFRATDHIERLLNSLHQIRIQYPEIYSFEEVAKELLARNGLLKEDATVYIQITRGVSPRGLAFPKNEVAPTVYVMANKVNQQACLSDTGVVAHLVDDVRWLRCDIKATTLLANVLAHQESLDSGAVIGIFNKNGIITEGTHVGVFAVKNQKIFTHPSGSAILPSITRQVVIELCYTLNYEVIETPVSVEDLADLDELFIVGTTPEITPVIRIDEIIVNQGVVGPITRQIQQAFYQLVYQQS